jgi:L,D-peptidoglycan transpeptidase YkuD (ErfK/YbiS/YcfS/YnhG family)
VPARFGSAGLTEGSTRRQGSNTTPTGIFTIPFTFGIKSNPGTAMPYRPVTSSAWWCQDNKSSAYNRWTDPRPGDCAAIEAERLVSFTRAYVHAAVIGFNYDRPVRGRGAGIFLHANGSGLTAGCVSISESSLVRLLRWLDPRAAPHIAIGTAGGATGITRY